MSTTSTPATVAPVSSPSRTSPSAAASVQSSTAGSQVLRSTPDAVGVGQVAAEVAAGPEQPRAGEPEDPAPPAAVGAPRGQGGAVEAERRDVEHGVHGADAADLGVGDLGVGPVVGAARPPSAPRRRCRPRSGGRRRGWASRPPTRSRIVALVHVPITTSVSSGCSAWPSGTPLRTSLTVPARDRAAHGLPAAWAGGSSASASGRGRGRGRGPWGGRRRWPWSAASPPRAHR